MYSDAEGFPPKKLIRNQYGFDEKLFYPGHQSAGSGRGLAMLFVGGCAPRKGLHYALEAWLKSPASRTGTFLIAGEFIPGYAEKLSAQLAHPSVKVLGHRSDVPELMRQSDLLTLPSGRQGVGRLQPGSEPASPSSSDRKHLLPTAVRRQIELHGIHRFAVQGRQ